MLRASLTLGFTLIVAGSLNAAPPDRPLPPKVAAKAMTLPEGFKATLFAGEPDVVQPIAFTFDDRGRLWVVECLSYPEFSAKPEGKDRVLIFEDTKGDGVFDKRTVFFDKGQNLTGIEYGFGGIWLCSAPNLLFIPIKDGEDKPAGPPQVVLDGWDYAKIKHNIYNGLTWGPDGWLYGCHGITSPSHVGKPGTPDDKRTLVSCGVWRYHPTRKTFEVFANGTTNPWGLDFDEYGEMFITNCVIAHLWHVVPGAHFERMYGQDPNPHVYGLMKTCADHLHWNGGPWTEARGGAKHSDAGGGHAHVGCMVYLGDNWPDEYRNNVFMCNLHGNRINRDILERKGSGYVAHHGKDFLFANDPWFRGIALKYGPDGGVYIADWTDTGECHNYKEVDRTNGRIFKVTYGTPKQWKGDLAKLNNTELAKLQTHKNEWFVRHARRLLQERSAARRLSDVTVKQLGELLVESKEESHQLRALWTLYATESLTSKRLGELMNVAKREVAVTVWGFRLDGEDSALNSSSLYRRLLDEAESGENATVLMQIASGLQRLPLTRGGLNARYSVATLLIRRERLAEDRNLSLMIWYAIEPLVTADEKSPRAALSMIAASKIPLIREYLAHRIMSEYLTRRGSTQPDSRDNSLNALLDLLADLTDDDSCRDVLHGIQDALAGRRSFPLPKGWEKAYVKLITRKSDEVRERATALAVMFDDPKAFADLRATVVDATSAADARERALQHLIFKAKPDLLPVLFDLLTDPALAGAAVRGLATFNDPKTPDILLKHYAAFSEPIRADAIATLSSRPAYAHALLDAVEKGSIPRTAITAFTARQLGGMKDKTVAEKLTRVWGVVRDPAKDKTPLMTKYKRELSADYLLKADLGRGRALFAKTCASCHKMFDDGGDVGPELTGSQRTNLDYVLENVLDPSAVVAREYQMNTITLKNGRVLNGIIKQENDKALTVRTEKETIVVPKDEIDTRTVSKQSMMPDGLFDKLSREEVRDLVGYLASPRQVALPQP